ncbi:hypothetical protein ACS0TY_029524 [Phlomoides rotata]
MNQNFFKCLPSEITVDILSRLPARTVACCKCVCKPWFDLVRTSEFVKYHLSKSVPTLLVFENPNQSKLYRVLEFEDDLNLERHELHFNPITEFRLPETYHGDIYGSVNGLLFLRDENLKPEGLFICNPITRDYIKLEGPPEFVCSDKHVAYGFGVSKISGEYKVVRISHECHLEGVGRLNVSIPEWQIYTLGTGSWRTNIALVPDHLFVYGVTRHSFLSTRNSGVFLNGILHWLAYDINGHLQIFCFDLETEAYFGLSSPLSHTGCFAALCVLGDSLCLCDSVPDTEVAIWSVKERGDKKVWVKVLGIRKTSEFYDFNYMRFTGLLFPIKIYKDGGVLFEWDGHYLVFYDEKNRRIEYDEFNNWHQAVIHTPSFLSLKRFDMENVSTF